MGLMMFSAVVHVCLETDDIPDMQRLPEFLSDAVSLDINEDESHGAIASVEVHWDTLQELISDV